MRCVELLLLWATGLFPSQNNPAELTRIHIVSVNSSLIHAPKDITVTFFIKGAIDYSHLRSHEAINNFVLWLFCVSVAVTSVIYLPEG